VLFGVICERYVEVDKLDRLNLHLIVSASELEWEF